MKKNSKKIIAVFAMSIVIPTIVVVVFLPVLIGVVLATKKIILQSELFFPLIITAQVLWVKFISDAIKKDELRRNITKIFE
jgi:uncharacterized membrane protein